MNNELLAIIQKDILLDIDGIHGLPHWKRVEEIGLYMAQETKADTEVVTLFAFLHDSKRENEDEDQEHGFRAAAFAEMLYRNGLLNLSTKQIHELIWACTYHSDSSFKSDNPTVQTCWDADRLDLWRLGIEPDPELLNTAIAKSKDSIEFARVLNTK